MDLHALLKQFQSRTPTILGSENFSKFAVLLPLIEKDGEIHILFEVRSHHMRRQPGEVCFPGGRFDPGDEDERFTAIRETSEELGVAPSDIEHVVPLDFMLSFSRIIYPFAGVLPSSAELNLNPDEVAEVFTVPLSYLLSVEPDCYPIHFKVEPEEDFPYELINGGKEYNWQTRKVNEYFYHYENRVIWGMTARILKHFLDMVKKSAPSTRFSS